MPTAVQQPPFLETLLKLPILDSARKAELSVLSERFPQPRALAHELVKRDWLTSFQANQIFLGHAEDLVVGPYLCLNKIGEGGMGHVFKAVHRGLDRIVALKVLRRECLSNSKIVQRFQREMRASGQLDHPHIVHAHDADFVNGRYYIAMEYIDGIDLARLVKRQGPIAIEQACDYIRQAALGLQHAADSGLVHRDIKPANLLLAHERNGGRLKILDLGLARLDDPGEAHLTALGTVMGTPDFIAPEQAVNPHTCDIRADLYSLGCTLYFLLTGRIPFPRGTMTDKLLSHQLREPEAMVEVRRDRLMNEAAKTGKRRPAEFFDIPPAVESVVRRLMAKRAEDRFQTPAELARGLRDVLASLESNAMSVTPSPTQTMPIAYVTPSIPEFVPTPPSSTAWQSLEPANGPEAIVTLQVPKNLTRSSTRWTLVAGACTLLITAVMWVQGHRSMKTWAGTNDMEATKRGER